MSTTGSAPARRIASIDQLRGYAIFGMLLVNASRACGIPFDLITHHRDRFSYADTIAPLFMFVVGMTMRLTYLRRCEQDGEAATRRAMYRRFGLMVIIGFTVYAGWIWDALVDIGLAALICIPLIGRKPLVRIAAAFAMPAIYQVIYLTTWYGPWIDRTVRFSNATAPLWVRLIPLHEALFRCPINGGMFGPLPRTMMVLFGTLAYDWMTGGSERRFLASCAAWGAGLCALGYVFCIAWPGVKPLWPISAYPSTVPFALMTTGTAFGALILFYLLCDRLGVRIPTFTAVGMNPIVIYVIQGLLLEVVDDFDPINRGPIIGIACFLLFYGAFAGLAIFLKSRRVYIRF